MSPTPRYWFPAKRHGIGWGLPATWQGWVAIALYAGAMALVFRTFPPASDLRAFLAGVCAATGVFTFVCWWKGEPMRWRWGRDS